MWASTTYAFSVNSRVLSRSWTTSLNSFYSDSSDYKSSDDYQNEEESGSEFGVPVGAGGDGDDTPSEEETPVPMSKNAGNRFLAFVFDRALAGDVDVMELHEQRVELSEDHVLYCRKANLYNETFNTESMADVLWSYQL